MDRQEARDAWQRLQPAETLEDMALVVSKGRDFQTWAMVELLCDESIRAASKDVRRAQDLALIAVSVAADLRVTEDWRLCLLGYAAAHLANAYRIINDLEQADWILEIAKRLWEAGRDPENLLDPGRLLDLEGSLRREQGRFRQALVALERAAPMTRRPVQVTLNIATTLEARGEYEKAIEVLLPITTLVEEHPERRLLTIHRFNLATCLALADRHREAALLLPSVGRLITELQDREDDIRYRWLEARIVAGLGYPEEALKGLADARQEFLQHDMHYDAALCLVESLTLQLSLGHQTEVQSLASELKPLFEQEALKGKPRRVLLVLYGAVTRRAATAEFAGRLLAILRRVRHSSRV